MNDRLRALWDFDDLDASEERFRALAEQESGSRRAEVLTQLARVHGLRDDFEAGDRLLDEVQGIADGSLAADVRVLLERGRLRRSSGDSAAALPLFVAAYDQARQCGEDFLAGDAAHMAALAAGDREGFEEWTQRGVELAKSSGAAVYWLGPLHNNLGWEYFDAGEYERALEQFELALQARLDHDGREETIQHAKDTLAEALRALGRS